MGSWTWSLSWCTNPGSARTSFVLDLVASDGATTVTGWWRPVKLHGAGGDFSDGGREGGGGGGGKRRTIFASINNSPAKVGDDGLTLYFGITIFAGASVKGNT